MYNGPKLISAARRAILRLTPEERAMVEAEIARRPAKPVIAPHGYDDHDASSVCPFCVAETVEQFVFDLESEMPLGASYFDQVTPSGRRKGLGRGRKKMDCGGNWG